MESRVPDTHSELKDVAISFLEGQKKKTLLLPRCQVTTGLQVGKKKLIGGLADSLLVIFAMIVEVFGGSCLGN